MKDAKNNKGILAALVIFILVIIVYEMFFKSDAVLPANPDASSSGVGSDVVALDASLQSVNLNQSLFNSPLYENLVDFSTPIPPQPAGKANPFASIEPAAAGTGSGT